MRGLTAEEILDLAEKPGFFGEGASVGRTDSALLQLRAATFGPTLQCAVDCPACGATLEFAVDAGQLLASAAEEQASYRWSGLGAEVEYRLPSYADVTSLAGCADAKAAQAALFARLVLTASLDGQRIEARALPPEVVEAVDAAMAEADPQAETEFRLDCGECGHGWVVPFDPAAYFERELAHEARRLMAEVHVLAGAYGWREPDILALSPGRRRIYLEWVLGS